MINERKIVLIAFATNDLKRSAKRLKYQALKSKYYTDIKIFSSNDLDEHTKSFIDDIIKKNGKRGFGYWYWKPCLILKILKELKDNDIVHYLDIGCHININNEKFKSYICYPLWRFLWGEQVIASAHSRIAGKSWGSSIGANAPWGKVCCPARKARY